ncbi:MAG TPA: DUF6638 family protein [Roseiflexaceae bacterium]|nr:DUF6638 family protein [Roseiflexaceae bacterium]
MSKLPWHGPLFSVRGHLAERYALALKQIAKRDCPIDEFSVDRLGWSPQLAAKLGDGYLGAGALRYAIILSPDQSEAPPVYRRFSYEAALIEEVYLQARPSLLNLVADEPVVIEIDGGITFCRTAGDLLGVQAALARVDTPRATLARTRELLELGHGLGEKVRLLDDGYIDQMLAIVQEVGDPRRRPLPPGIRVPIGSLWGDVDGSAYVLRPRVGHLGATLLIATRPGKVGRGMVVTQLELDEPRVVDVLTEEGFLHYKNASMLLPKRLGELEIDALLASGEPAPAADTTARRRQLAGSQAAQEALSELYWELDTEQKRMAGGGSVDLAGLSVAARWALATPARDPEVIGHLLARFVRYDYRLMAHHHRRIVEAEWDRYSEAKRRYLAATFPYMVQGFVEPPAN